MQKLMIFCDFDGTITETDNIVSIMKKFAPEQSAPIIKKILNQQQSIRDGVSQMFSLLNTNQKEEIVEYLGQNAKIRSGFQEFIEFINKEQLPLYIVSGGIDFFVEPMLAPYGPFTEIYCNSADFTGDSIKILFPNQCDEKCEHYATQACGCCKPSIMRKLVDQDTFSIVIGDSVTDFEAAKQADFVLARDVLIEKCQEMHIPYQPFETFHDCREFIQHLLEERRL